MEAASASPSNPASILDLPFDLFTAVCQQLDLRGLIFAAAACKRFRHGDGGLETSELPTKSPVVTALRELAFSRPELVPSTRPVGCCDESWVAYLARCARQRRCREVPVVAAGGRESLFADAARRLLTCGKDATIGDGFAGRNCNPIPLATMAEVRVQSVVAGVYHRLALGWDGRVYSWGDNGNGQLGLGDRLNRLLPALVEGLDGVRGIATATDHSLAVTQSGAVFSWGRALVHGAQPELRPILVEGFGEVRVRRGSAGKDAAFAIGGDGELFSWGSSGGLGLLGRGHEKHQPLPKRVGALQAVRVTSVSVGHCHVLALAEDGLVYAWGQNEDKTVLGNAYIQFQLLPKPVEALRGVRVCSVAASAFGNYAVADTGELWAWGYDSDDFTPLGHGEQSSCPLPKPIKSLRGVKVDAVAALERHTLALADDGSVYVWGDNFAAEWGSLGLGPSVNGAHAPVLTPQRIPGLRLACGLWRDELFSLKQGCGVWRG
jgi:hypothetical protein